MLPKPTFCSVCPYQDGEGYIPPEGPPSALVRVCGEAPGEDERDEGRPFVGASGRTLRRGMKTAGFPGRRCGACAGMPWPARGKSGVCGGCGVDHTAAVLIWNTICCRPPGNDYGRVSAGAASYCQEAHRVPPPPPGSVTFLVGGRSLGHFFPELRTVKGMDAITRWQGSALPLGDGWAVPVIHPAAVMRRWSTLPVMVAALAGGLGLVGKVPGVDPPFTLPVLVTDRLDPGPDLAVDIETGADGGIELVGATTDGVRVWQGTVAEVGSVLQPALDAATTVFAHNAKFDVTRLEAVGLRFRRHTIVDTMWAQSAHLSDVTAKAAGLDDCVAVTLAGRQLWWKGLWGTRWPPGTQELTRGIWKKIWPAAEADWYRAYNSLDVVMTWRLGVRLREVLSAGE